MPVEFSLIAPCGMNCGICAAHLRKKRVCPGCREADTNKSASCIKCIIKNCETIEQNQTKFCYQCEIYPCKRLKQLDKRYRAKYKMSMLENLESIRTKGLKAFIENERVRWYCSRCSGVICVHKGYCLECGPAAE